MEFLLSGRVKFRLGFGNKMKNIVKIKKGQVFTIIAVFLVVLSFLSFEFFAFLQENKSVKTRVSTMDSFLDSVEENLERQIYISGFRILFLAESEIVSTGNYIGDIDAFFQEAFFNGTVNGIQETSILPGATYSDLVNSLNDKAASINVNISLNNSKLYVNQSDPWNLDVTLVSDFLMFDKNNLARWDKVQVISAAIPVKFFEDPVFTVNSLARVSRKINQTIYEGNYVIGTDVSNLQDHVDKGYYAANVNAPSFLRRFEGDLSADPNGIESFVNIPELSAQGIATYDKTTIDYIYFSTNNPVHYGVTGMYSWFRIDSDDNHFVKYNVTGLTY